MTLSTLRIEVPDHPGALAAVTRVLAKSGLNVVEVSIHEVDGATAVDEVIVSAAVAPEVAGLRQAIAAAGAELLSVAACEERSDVVLAAMAWTCESLDHPQRLATLAAGVQILTGISPARAVSPADAERTAIGSAALRRGGSVVRREPRAPDVLPQVGGVDSGAWVLAAADGLDPSVVVLAARPLSIRFTATEVRRLDAILNCRRRLLQATSAEPSAQAAVRLA